MTCRDCGVEGRPFSNLSRVRSDICDLCFETRGNVIKARQENRMSQPDFENYQRNGLRTKRLLKMGYSELVATRLVKTALEKEGS